MTYLLLLKQYTIPCGLGRIQSCEKIMSPTAFWIPLYSLISIAAIWNVQHPGEEVVFVTAFNNLELLVVVGGIAMVSANMPSAPDPSDPSTLSLSSEY